jgi:protein-L-isoaspartate(D-aspartate) O-methyltransferase
VPEPLAAQLKEGGRMVIPVGSFFQDLKVFIKKGGKLAVEKTLPVRFVPMTGKAE